MYRISENERRSNILSVNGGTPQPPDPAPPMSCRLASVPGTADRLPFRVSEVAARSFPAPNSRPRNTTFRFGVQDRLYALDGNFFGAAQLASRINAQTAVVSDKKICRAVGREGCRYCRSLLREHHGNRLLSLLEITYMRCFTVSKP